jgi:hypothetical protein
VTEPARPRSLPLVAALLTVVGIVGLVAIVGTSRLVGRDTEDDGSALLVPAALRSVDERIDAVARDDRFAAPRVPIDGLRDGESRLVEVTGLPRRAALRAVVCSVEPARCGAALPIRSDDSGVAQFLFEFESTLRPASTAIGNADCTQQACVLEVTADDDEPLVSTPVVFGAPAPQSSLRVERPRNVRVGDDVVAHLSGFAAGARVTVTLCTPPGPIDRTRCGSPAPEVDVVLDDDGRAVAILPARATAVGTHGARCGRGDPCAVAVLGRPDVAVTALTFAGAGPADPGPLQLTVGLLVAAGLLAAAVVVLRRGPWTPPDGDPFEGVTVDDPFAGLRDDDADLARSR